MNLLSRAGDRLVETVNPGGRSAPHVAAGVLVCLGVVAASALLARRSEPGAYQRHLEREAGGDRGALSAVWPALFSITTLAALRLWNAPSSPERTRALTLWGASQALNAAWMVVSPRLRLLELAGGLATAALTAAYAREARRADARAGGMAAPAAGLAIGNLVTGEVWRRSAPAKPTLH